MPYNPTFTRNTRGNYSQDKSFLLVRAGTDAYLLEDELNELQAIAVERPEAALRGITSSGPFAAIGGVSVSGTDQFQFDKFQGLIDGTFFIAGGFDKDLIGGANAAEKNWLKMPAKPASGTRTDLVILEVFEAEVKQGDLLYKYGCIGGKQLTNDLRDSRIGQETSRRIQLQKELRVLQNMTNPDKDATGNATSTYTNVGNGLWRSGNGRMAIRLFTFARNSTEVTLPGPTVVYEVQTLINLPTPTRDDHAANKGYVDSVAQGLDVKQSVRVATTANITLSAAQTIDGVAVAAGDRVLVKDQTTASQNGIYVVQTGSWTRATDADTNAKATPGMFVFVESGTVNGDSGWVLTTDGTVTLGTTNLTFVQFSGAGQITVAGNSGLTKSGNSLSISTKGVTTGMIGDKQVDTLQINDSAVTLAKLHREVEKKLHHSATGFVLGNQDWTGLTYGTTGTVAYDAANKGVKLTGASEAKVRIRFPVDPDSVYRVRAKARKIDGTGSFYIGAVSLDNSYNALTTDGANAWNYFGASNITIGPGSSQVFEGTISGYNVPTTGADNSKFDPEANYFDLIVLGNYGGTGNTVVEWLEIRKEDVNDADLTLLWMSL